MKTQSGVRFAAFILIGVVSLIGLSVFISFGNCAKADKAEESYYANPGTLDPSKLHDEVVRACEFENNLFVGSSQNASVANMSLIGTIIFDVLVFGGYKFSTKQRELKEQEKPTQKV